MYCYVVWLPFMVVVFTTFGDMEACKEEYRRICNEEPGAYKEYDVMWDDEFLRKVKENA